MGVVDLVEDVVCKVVQHVHTQIKTNKANRKLRKDVEASVARAVRAGKSPYEEDFQDASLQEVLAMSVDGVYYRDHNGMDLNFIVKPLVEGEYEVDERMAHFTSNMYWTRFESISEQEEKDARIKHYVRRPRNPCASAPKLIIAIRGTKLSSGQDLVDDVRISMSTLGFSSCLKQGEDLIKKIIQEYKNWQREDDDDGYSSESSPDTEPASHTSVSCDVCNMCPIIGPRFKSTKRDDYDLCQKCYLRHGDFRDYKKIDRPEWELGRGSDSELEQSFSRVQISSSVQHCGVWCDECYVKPIIGNRYKSNKLYDYDLCHKCFLKHGRSRDYSKIVKPPPFMSFDYEGTVSSGSESGLSLNSGAVEHPGVQCDVCNVTPIIGNRYKSNKLHNYDLCHKCFLKHGQIQDYRKIDKPLGRTRAQLQYREPYDSEVDGDDSQTEDDDSETENDMRLVLSRPVLKRVQHPRVQCDICKISPIVGIRYKSIRKHNYDLCQECFQEHGALKDYTKIEKPEGTSSASSSRGDIYITGHSLGAALALQIGKKLAAEEKQRYNVHCFNPPFLTIVQLIQEGIFISKAKQMLRKSPLEPLMKVASHVKSLTKLTVAMMMDNEEQLVTEVKHFMNLIDWVPVLYINGHDGICKRFKKHYKLKQKVSAGFEVCSQALVSQVLGRRALFSSLVPSVDMRISKLSDDPHAVKNWYRSPRIDKFSQYRLLPGVYFAGLPIHSLAKSILYHPDSDQEEDSDLDEEVAEHDLNSVSTSRSYKFITEHSLALLIGKKLAAKENQRCQVHSFNPPFLTIVQLIQQWLGIDKAKQLLWESKLGRVIEAATQLIKVKMAVMLKKGEQLMKHFTNLEDWVVLCNINKHEWICNEMKKYYKRKQKVEAASKSTLKR